MNLRGKKIIAREFIFFISCILISILTFSSIYLYNHLIQREIEDIQNEIISNTKIKDNIIRQIEQKRERQISYTKAYQKEFNFSNETIKSSEIWQMLYLDVKNDSIEYKWNNIWSEKLLNFEKNFGIQSPKELSEFISFNTVNIKNIKLSEKIKNEIQLLKNQRNFNFRKTIDSFKQFEITKNIFYFSIFILFILRYIIIGIIWSFKILKEKK